jgi:hypothetical protein
MILCGNDLRFNLLGGVRSRPSDKRRSKDREEPVGFQTAEALSRFHHACRRPAERHGGISPSLHIATDATHRPHHVLDRIGAGERATQLGRQLQTIDGQDLVEPFENAGRNAGRLRAGARDCVAAARPCRRRRAPRLGAAPGGPTHAETWVSVRSRCGPYGFGTALVWLSDRMGLGRPRSRVYQQPATQSGRGTDWSIIPATWTPFLRQFGKPQQHRGAMYVAVKCRPSSAALSELYSCKNPARHNQRANQSSGPGENEMGRPRPAVGDRCVRWHGTAIALPGRDEDILPQLPKSEPPH